MILQAYKVTKMDNITMQMKVFSYVVLLQLCLACSLFDKLSTHPFILFGIELILVSSAFWVYNELQSTTISDIFVSGMQAIKEKDFSRKFALTGVKTSDKFINVYNNIIDELRSERTKQFEQQQFIDNFIEAAPMGIIVYDFNGKAAFANSSAKEILTEEVSMINNNQQWNTSSFLLDYVEELFDGCSKVIRIKGKVLKVQKSCILDRGFHRTFLVISEISQELYESEKKTYDILIRMMAHEVNNTIGAINSILDTARSVVNDEGHYELSNALRVGLERNNRCCSFMERLSELAKLPKPRKQSTDLNLFIKDIAFLMRPSIEDKCILFKVVYNDKPIFCEIDIGQFEQLLVNVLKNAIDACFKHSLIEIEITEIELIIRNNGIAIPKEIVNKLFEPFFSNKPNGQGIGLTIARSILASHGLPFSLQTDTDGWTKFSVIHNISYIKK